MNLKSYKSNLAMFVIALILIGQMLSIINAPAKAGFFGTTAGDNGYDGYFLENLMNAPSHTINSTVMENDLGKRSNNKRTESRITGINAYQYSQDNNLDSANPAIARLNLGFQSNQSSYEAQRSIKHVLSRYMWNSVGKNHGNGGGDFNYTRLLFTFPGNAGSQYTARTATDNSKPAQRDISNLNTSAADDNKAANIQKTLVNDFNSALAINYSLSQDAHKIPKNPNYTQFAKLVEDTANLKFAGGVKVSINSASNGRVIATIKPGSSGDPSASGKFVIRMLKGYIANNRTTYTVNRYKGGKTQDIDQKYLSWRDIALEAISAWGVSQNTYSNIDSANNMSDKFEQSISNMFGGALRWLTNLFGLASPADLIYNLHYRSSSYWWRGIMPNNVHNVYEPIRRALVFLSDIGFMFAIARLLLRIARGQALSTIGARINAREELLFIFYAIILTNMQGVILDFLTQLNVKIVHIMYLLADGNNGNVDHFMYNSFGFTSMFSIVIVALIVFIFEIWYTMYYYYRLIYYIACTIFMPVFYAWDANFNDGSQGTRSSVMLWQELSGLIFAQAIQSVLLTLFYKMFSSIM